MSRSAIQASAQWEANQTDKRVGGPYLGIVL